MSKINQLSSAALVGLANLVSNSFQMTAISNAKLVPIVAPNQALATLTTLPATNTPINGLANVGATPASNYSRWRFYFANAVYAPSWLKPGAAVAITGNTSNANGNVALNIATTVMTVDPAGTYFEVAVKNSLLTSQLTADVLQNTPLVTLIIEAQKVVFATPAGNTDSVIVSDGADINGVSQGWSQAIPAGNAGYDYAPVTGAKFNLGDWFVKSNSGAQTIMIRFL
jgi:hypothetical protein